MGGSAEVCEAQPQRTVGYFFLRVDKIAVVAVVKFYLKVDKGRPLGGSNIGVSRVKTFLLLK